MAAVCWFLVPRHSTKIQISDFLNFDHKVTVICIAATAATAVVAFPLAVAGIGFGATGIAAGSTAATMMASGVPMVPILQSIGAAGMGAASYMTVGGAGAGLGYLAALIALWSKNSKKLSNFEMRTFHL